MRVVVVGAGVMGLAAGRVLAERGHEVVVLDRFGVSNRWASSPGSERIWRLAHPDRARVRLAGRAVAAWRDVERRSGRTVLLQRGLLWRAADAPEVVAAVTAEGAPAGLVDVAEQARLFPELAVRTDLPVAYQPEAGVVLAAEGLAAQAELLVRAGGTLVAGEVVAGLGGRPGGGVTLAGRRRTYDADVAVVAAGPWAGGFLGQLGIDLALHPVLEQVTYVRGGPDAEDRPCVIDDFGSADAVGFYAMPAPGVGFKIGIDAPVRTFAADDLDRSPDPAREAQAAQVVAESFPGLDPTVVRSQVCSWTASPDDLFVLDRVGDVVLGCGDSGQAFKFSPLLGEILADLAEGRHLDADAASLSLARFSRSASSS